MVLDQKTRIRGLEEITIWDPSSSLVEATKIRLGALLNLS
jgi:hypothetical protein